MTQSRPAKLISPELPKGETGTSLEERAVVVPITTDADTELPGVSFTLAGFTVHVASFGAPEQAKLIVSLKVALAARVIVTTPFWPLVRVREVGVPEAVKAGGSVATETDTAVEEVSGLKLASPLYTAVMTGLPAGSTGKVKLTVPVLP